ncbi:MAG: hypothetical protein FJZ16_04130 [Candidatus Omnitrophica bacterium]|nr:hypothetical protein [Candidatus Omnitrophota bacterium]
MGNKIDIPDLKTFLSIAMFAHVIAYFSNGFKFGARYAIAFIVSLVVLPFLWMTVLRLIFKSAAKELQKFEPMHNKIKEIQLLPFEEAKRLALAKLVDTQRFECVEAKLTNANIIQDLSPSLKELFTKYESIRVVSSDNRLSRSEISLSKLNRMFIKIGDGSCCAEVVVEPRKETVFIIDGTEPPEKLKGDNYLSIWHWILVKDFVAHD